MVAGEYRLLPTGVGSEEGRSSAEDEEDAGEWSNGREVDRWTELQRRLACLYPSCIVIWCIVAFISSAIVLTFFSGSTPISDPPESNSDYGYFHTGDVWEHNDLVSAHLDRCASLDLLRNTSFSTSPDPLEPTYLSSGCGTNSTTLIILSSIYFAEAYSGSTTGEEIWAKSIMTSLNRWGYSYMFSSLGWWNDDMTKTMEIYRQYHGQVRMVIADPGQVVLCFGKQNESCIRSEDNPTGMEEWRFLGLNFWETNDPEYGPAYPLPPHPLGSAFTLSPAPPSQTSHFSLPYSIEPTCRLSQVEKIKPPRAYIMAKKSSLLSPNLTSFPWTIPALAEIADDIEVDLVIGLKEDDDPQVGELLSEYGIRDLGKLGSERFREELGGSFVLIGAGRPFISPSPWDALCLGVPFINPILAWDESDPNNKSYWKMQHGHMMDLEPPYVYSFHSHDYPALRTAIKSALHNPIKSFIPEYMKFEVVSNRVGEMIQLDWEEVYLRQRGLSLGI